MSSSHDHRENFADYDFAAAVWRRRKWLAIVVASAGIAAALPAVLSLPDVYRASATVLVERQQVSEAFVRPSVTAELETRIQTIHQQIMSRARLTDVIRKLNLYPDLRGVAPMSGLVERMRREVKLSPIGVEQVTGRMATIAFSVSYIGRDPEAVAGAVNTLVAEYVGENSRSRERQAARTAEFLKAQLDAVKAEVDEQERRSGQFKQQYTAELPEQMEANLAALDRFNTQLRLNGEYQIRALERRERLEREVNSPLTSNTPADLPSPTTQLQKLRQQLVDLRSKYSDRYPDVIRVKAEIAALESETSLTTTATNGHSVPAATNGRSVPVIAGQSEPAAPEDGARRLAVRTLNEVQKDLEALREQERLLRQVITTYEARIENAPKRSEELQQLSRDYGSSKDRYDALLKRYDEAKTAESLEHGQNVEQLRILDPAIPPGQPFAPNRLWLLVLGVLASLGLGFAAMVAAEQLDTTFHTVDDLRGFANVPNVAAIRHIPTPTQSRQRRVRLALMTVFVLVAIAVIAAGSYYVAGANEHLLRLASRGAQ